MRGRARHARGARGGADSIPAISASGDAREEERSDDDGDPDGTPDGTRRSLLASVALLLARSSPALASPSIPARPSPPRSPRRFPRSSSTRWRRPPNPAAWRTRCVCR